MASTLLDVPIVDVDSHILEPPDLWTARLPAKWRDEAPHIVTDPATGLEKWLVADRLTCGAATHSAVEWDEFWPSRPTRFEDATVGSWEPAARLRWMDACGVQAQVQYPNILGFYIWAFLHMDEPLRLECVKVYNDYQVEFCAASPERLIPLAQLPWWDIDESITELERCIAMGHRGINLGWEFEKLGFPRLRDPHWEPLLRCAEEAAMPVNFHIGFNNSTEEAYRAMRSIDDILQMVGRSAPTGLGNAACIAELIAGGLCDRFPMLKFVSVESGFGYIPFLLQAMDWQYVNMGGTVKYADRLLPSDYFRRQIYTTFWFERIPAESLEAFADNVMFETDYPHGTSLSPGKNSFAKPARETVLENLAHVPSDVAAKVLYQNAAKVYGITGTSVREAGIPPSSE